jgi:hypothetical protein
MTLRVRLRRWWRPARREDDHPAERKQPNKNGDDWVSALGDWGRRVVDSNFRKPR